MGPRVQPKTTYEVYKEISPIYTGGPISLSRDGQYLASCVEEDAVISDAATGEVVARADGVCIIHLPPPLGLPYYE